MLSLGSRITRQALPLLAITSLEASPADLGVLQALSAGPSIVVGLFLKGAVVRIGLARSARLGVLARGLVLASIPIAHFAGVLSLAVLFGAVVAYGAVAALSEIAERCLLPAIVPDLAIVEANARLATSDASAEIVGPLVMGVLVAVVTPVYSIVADVIGYAVAFLCMLGVRATPEFKDETRTVSASGLSTIRSDLELAGLAGSLLLSTFSNEAMRSVYTLHVVRTMGLSALQLGVTFAFGGLGLLLGATCIRRWRGGDQASRCAVGLGLNAFGLSLFPVSSVSAVGGVAWLMAGQLVSDFGLIVFLVSVRSRIQSIVPARAMPDVFASLAVGSGLMVMGGAVTGGAAAGAFGTGAALCLPPSLKLIGLLVVLLAAQAKNAPHIHSTEI